MSKVIKHKSSHTASTKNEAGNRTTATKIIKYVALFSVWSLSVGTVFSAYAAKESPYVVEKKIFKKQIGSLAMSPLHVPAMLDISTDMRAHVEAEALKALRKTKIKNIASDEYVRLHEVFGEQVGIVSGVQVREGQDAPDLNRLAAVRDHVKRELRLRHSVDGFAEISLVPVSALFADDRAEWDGVKRKVKSSGDGFSLFGGKNYQGTIAGVSFQLAIYDRNQNLLYLKRGGIDVLQERKGEALLMRTDAYLDDEKRLKKAVQIAFKPL